MSIIIFGSGGVGGYFGARFAAAGEDVGFVARGAHAAAMREHGLRVLSPDGDLTVDHPRVSDDPCAFGRADVVLVCVKLWDTEAAARALRPVVDDETAVISLQNGIDAEDVLARILGPGPVMGGTARISSHIEAPGVICHVGAGARLELGELDGRESARGDRFLEACRAAGIDAVLMARIREAIWRKFILLVALSGATTLARTGIGAVFAEPAGRDRFAALVAETTAVARAEGADLAPDTEAKALAIAEKFPAAMKASMLVDLERGNRLELDWLAGAVVRLGRKHGIGTPANAEVYAALKPFASGSAG